MDLFPDYTSEELRSFLEQQAGKQPPLVISEILGGILHKQIAALIVRRAAGDGDVNTNAAGQIARCVQEMKFWRHDITGVAGFENAQATYGGLSLDDFYVDSLESKFAQGLYAAGEILDVTGECGGYNLHWAWVSGYLAGSRAAGSA